MKEKENAADPHYPQIPYLRTRLFAKILLEECAVGCELKANESTLHPLGVFKQKHA